MSKQQELKEILKLYSKQDLWNRIQEKQAMIYDLEAKLAESEKSKESYRLQNEQHHLQLLQFYSRLGVEAFGADIHEKALETLMIMKEEIEEKNGVRRALSACNRQNDEFADMIKKLVSEKEELKQQLAEKEKEIQRTHNYYQAVRNRETIRESKISFAVEQLEKVKGLIANHTQELWTCENDDIDVVLYEEIDKQINELKGEKK